MVCSLRRLRGRVRNIYLLLKGSNWGAFLPFHQIPSCGELLTIEKYNEVLCWAPKWYFFASFNHIFTCSILGYVAATFSSGAKNQPVLATTWVGNLSRPDSWTQTEEHKKAKGGDLKENMQFVLKNNSPMKALTFGWIKQRESPRG